VDVLGGTLQLGERGQGDTRFGGGRVVDLEQDGLVGLDDQWSVTDGHCGLLMGGVW
jgi:hypothetical protein